MNVNIPNQDTFADSFEAFRKSRHFDRLTDKYRIRPYFEKYATVRMTAWMSSYFLNLCSVLTAFAAVFSILVRMMPSWPAAFFSFVLLALLEAVKRFFSPLVVRRWLQFGKVSAVAGVLVVCLVAASATLSYTGAGDAVRMMSTWTNNLDKLPGQTWTNVQDNVQVNVQVNDQVRKPYLDQLSKLERDKELVRKQTWKGKLTSEAARQLTGIQRQEAAIREAMQEAVREANNQQKVNELKTEVQAGKFAFFALSLDVLLVVCLVFLEYYDFRSLAEFSAIREDGSKAGNRDKQPGQTWTNVQDNVQVNVQDKLGQSTWTKKDNVQVNVQEGSCLVCGEKYLARTSWQKFCGKDCRLAYHAGRHQGKVFNPAIYRKPVGVNGSRQEAW